MCERQQNWYALINENNKLMGCVKSARRRIIRVKGKTQKAYYVDQLSTHEGIWLNRENV